MEKEKAETQQALASKLTLLRVFVEGEEVKAPQAEALVLQGLLQCSPEGANGAEISRKTGNRIAASAVYTLLNRLEKRGLVLRTETWFATNEGIPVRRILYAPARVIEVKEQKGLANSSSGSVFNGSQPDAAR